MKKCLYICAAIFSFLFIALSSAFPAAAAQQIDLSIKGSIDVQIRDSEDGKLYVEQASMYIHKIAALQMVDGSLRYVALAEYEDLNIDFDALDSASQPAVIEAVLQRIAQRGIEPLQSLSGNTGRFFFENLELGVFLLGYESEGGKLQVDPFLVAIPAQSEEGGQWYYDVKVYPKNEIKKPPKPTPTKTSTPVPTGPPQPTPSTPEKLPQTGMLRWPILLMASLGIILFAAGWVDIFIRPKEKPKA